MSARTLSTALWCSVMPSVQQIIARGRRRECVGQLADGLRRDAGLLLGVLERVRLDLGLVGLEVRGRTLDELAVLEPGRDDLAGDRVGQGDVAADVECRASRSAHSADDVRRGSTAYRRAPLRTPLSR